MGTYTTKLPCVSVNMGDNIIIYIYRFSLIFGHTFSIGYSHTCYQLENKFAGSHTRRSVE